MDVEVSGLLSAYHVAVLVKERHGGQLSAYCVVLINPLGPRGQIWDTYVPCVNEYTRIFTLAATWFYLSISR